MAIKTVRTPTDRMRQEALDAIDMTEQLVIEATRTDGEAHRVKFVMQEMRNLACKTDAMFAQQEERLQNAIDKADAEDLKWQLEQEALDFVRDLKLGDLFEMEDGGKRWEGCTFKITKVNPKTVRCDVVNVARRSDLTLGQSVKVDRSHNCIPVDSADFDTTAVDEAAADTAAHAAAIKVGVEVRITFEARGKWAGMTGVVEKANPKKAKVKTALGIVNVPYTLLEIV